MRNPAKARHALHEAAKRFVECDEKAKRSANYMLQGDLVDATDALDEMALSFAMSLGYRKGRLQ